MGRHEDEHLRRFVQARRRGDRDAMRRTWEEVVIDFQPRLDGLVGAEHRGRLDAAEHEAAVTEALRRFGLNLLWTFEGTSMGELVNATKPLVRNACIDEQRRSMRRHRHDGVSLDELREDPEGDRAAENWAHAQQARAEHERSGERAEARQFVDWALTQLDGRLRRVVELTLAGAPIDEIMEELGVSRDNAYQLRSRALKKLKGLKEDDDA